jgi:hypothetical protein
MHRESFVRVIIGRSQLIRKLLPVAEFVGILIRDLDEIVLLLVKALHFILVVLVSLAGLFFLLHFDLNE